MSTTVKLLTGCSVLATLSACVWVDLTPSGEKARVLSAAEARHCRPVGRVTANTTAELGLLSRDRNSVREELDRLARNHAGSLGGDTVVPVGRIVNGSQAFDVYRCVPP